MVENDVGVELSRRHFVARLTTFGGCVCLLKAVPGLAASGAEVIRFNGEGSQIEAYRALPTGRPRSGILVLADESGLGDHILAVTRRLGAAGYAVLAPDLYSRLGGTAAVAADPTAAIQKLNDSQIGRDLDLSFAHLERTLGPEAKIGVLGFGWGATRALTYATENPDVAAVATYYGANPDPLDRLLNLEAPLLGNYAALDEPVSAQLATLEATLKKHRKTYDFKSYPAVKAAFDDSARLDRFNSEAAKDAWERTLQFFARVL